MTPPPGGPEPDVRVRAVLQEYDVLGAPVPADLVALTELAAVLCGVSTASVNILEDDTQHVVAAEGPLITAGSCARHDALCAVAQPTDRLVVVPDARLDPEYAANPWVTGALGRIVFYASAPLRSPDGVPVGTLCVYDDVPRTLTDSQVAALGALAAQVVDLFELRRRSRQLQDKVRELERSQQQLVTFAGQISHDLKTPLTSIIGFAEMAADRPTVAGDPVALRYVERIQGSGRRMLGLIDDLLDYARVGGTLRHERVDVAAVLDQVKADMRWSAVGAGVRLEGGGHVLGDPSQIRLLVQNLVSNALKYGRDSGAQIAVRVEAYAGGHRLSVVDNGSGIPSGERARVLEPLARLRDDVPGTGLGLATCQRIARAHGGSLALGDTPGGGLTVSVDLPDVAPA